MALVKEQLERDFICPKCRGRGALAQEVIVGRVVGGVFPLPSNRYLTATCGLCGYTEFYNLALMEKCTERENAAQPAEPIVAPKT